MKSSRLDSGKLYSAFSMVAAVYHEAEEVSKLRENAAREGWDYAPYSIAIADAAGGTGLSWGSGFWSIQAGDATIVPEMLMRLSLARTRAEITSRIALSMNKWRKALVDC